MQFPVHARCTCIVIFPGHYKVGPAVTTFQQPGEQKPWAAARALRLRPRHAGLDALADSQRLLLLANLHMKRLFPLDAAPATGWRSTYTPGNLFPIKFHC